MSRLLVSNLVWMVGWIGLYFGVMELLALLWHGCPWRTFSWTLWQDQKRVPFLSAIVIAVMALLSAHLERTQNVQEGD